MINTTKNVPFIAHMIIIKDTMSVKRPPEIKNVTDKSYYNARYDSKSEYCRNTSTWD